MNIKLEKLLFALIENKPMKWSVDDSTYEILLNKTDKLLLFSTDRNSFNIRINGQTKAEHGDIASTALLINSRNEIINFLTYVAQCSELNRKVAYTKDNGDYEMEKAWTLGENVLKGVPLRNSRVSCSNARTVDFDRLIEIDSLYSKNTIEVKFPSNKLFMGNISIKVKIKDRGSFMRFIPSESIDEYPYLKKQCRIFDKVEKPEFTEVTSCDQFIERLKVYKNKEISSLAFSMSLEESLYSKEIISPTIKI